jgi:carbamate kinase
MHTLIALGGNALLKRGESLSPPHQQAAIDAAAASLAALVQAGHHLVIAHGSGPQVGLLECFLSGEKHSSRNPDRLIQIGTRVRYRTGSECIADEDSVMKDVTDGSVFVSILTGSHINIVNYDWYLSCHRP